MIEFKLYGFYDNKGKLIEAVPDTDMEGAKAWFKSNNPDKEYMYIEVIKREV